MSCKALLQFWFYKNFSSLNQKDFIKQTPNEMEFLHVKEVFV